MNENETNEQRFRQMGVERVRLLVNTGGFITSIQIAAIVWLSQRDEEERLRRDSSQAEQVEIERSAKDAAWAAARAAERAAAAAEAANKRATIAIIVAAISITTAVVSISMVHWDATRPSVNMPQKH